MSGTPALHPCFKLWNILNLAFEVLLINSEWARVYSDFVKYRPELVYLFVLFSNLN